MIRSSILAAASVAVLAFSPFVTAQQASYGSAAEARSMLERAVLAVKANKAKALEMFNKGEGGFKDRDLQPFCFNQDDGKLVATIAPRLLGTDIRTLKDKSGKEFGKAIFEAGTSGKTTEVRYVFPRPGGTTPLPKISFVTAVGDVACGVGYYP